MRKFIKGLNRIVPVNINSYSDTNINNSQVINNASSLSSSSRMQVPISFPVRNPVGGAIEGTNNTKIISTSLQDTLQEPILGRNPLLSPQNLESSTFL